ncbi:MAG TPA: hypothetical protein PLU30_05600 [Verrucomicrobiae bacterium]|nr:hypothetical protein [Verrucomicrobiae bacterium]
MALLDSSDFRKALDLIRALSAPSQLDPTGAPCGVVSRQPPDLATPRAEDVSAGRLSVPLSPARFLADEMTEILRDMCRRGGFSGAVVADGRGLPIADFHCPVEPEAMAACCSVLGEAIEHSGRLLRQGGVNGITMEIGQVDKVVLQRFEIESAPCFLMVICPRAVDVRVETEGSIRRITSVLGRVGRLAAGGFTAQGSGNI